MKTPALPITAEKLGCNCRNRTTRQAIRPKELSFPEMAACKLLGTGKLTVAGLLGSELLYELGDLLEGKDGAVPADIFLANVASEAFA